MIHQIAVRGFDKNFSYLIENYQAKEVIIVDPVDFERLDQEIRKRNLEPKLILITHSHFDHIEGVGDFVSEYKIPVYIHKKAQKKVNFPTKILSNGDIFDLGSYKIEVIYAPGHLDDCVCFLVKDFSTDELSLISGDTLFVEGCGRADFPDSDVKKLYQSLEFLKTLPDSTKVYPGHDYGSKSVSTIKWEKEHNPYLKVKNLQEFVKLRN